MYGGDNFRQSQFNLAVQGERQPGSSFKPFVLATALKQGISPVTTFPSKPVLDLHRRQVLAGAQLRERLHRLGRPRDRDGGVGQQHLRAAHPTRRTGQRRADRARARDHAAPESVLRDRARRRCRQPARDGARVLHVRERRPPGGQLWIREPSPRDRAHQQRRGKDGRGQPAGEPRRPRPRSGRAAHEHPRRSRPLRDGQARDAGGPRCRGEDRHDGELRRCVVRRVHAAARDGGVGRVPEQVDSRC